MLTISINCIEERTDPREVNASGGALTIRCYVYPPLTASALWPKLNCDRELTAQAIRLLMRLDFELRAARADWNDDRFRRIMRLRPRAVRRLIRRWERLDPKPVVPLGNLRRRYHSNLAGHLYDAHR